MHKVFFNPYLRHLLVILLKHFPIDRHKHHSATKNALFATAVCHMFNAFICSKTTNPA